MPPVILLVSPRDGSETEAKAVQLSGLVQDDQGWRLWRYRSMTKSSNLRDRGRPLLRSGGHKAPGIPGEDPSSKRGESNKNKRCGWGRIFRRKSNHRAQCREKEECLGCGHRRQQLSPCQAVEVRGERCCGLQQSSGRVQPGSERECGPPP